MRRTALSILSRSADWTAANQRSDVTKRTDAMEPAHSGMAIETGHAWGPLDLVGGLPCLDFANTAGGHTKIREVERIPTFEDVVRWALCAEILTSSEARAALNLAKHKPQDTARQVRELHLFREALHRLVSAIATGSAIEPKAYAQV